ncbi:hypothetical protein B0H17DRAFT_1158938 [Mycena rosella]|uniref:Metallo-beta-lactamase domain-containing protein n=1 Tax=Mycena rosella TaxID=1033263 RepID=A0AAD7GHQ4_MYCRO|nr:hypothetical protein B0H17DRAFT_1158938 [Mycena rosella]
MSFQDLGIPASSSTVTVKVFDLIDNPSKVVASAAAFLTPVLPGHENLTCTVFAFLVENTTTGQRVMFDLGPRKDLENSVPYVAEAVKAGQMVMPVSKDIVEQLAEAGIEAESISTVIWSHSHVDHTGDMSKFPASTDLAVGKDTVMDTNDANPQSSVLASDVAGRKLVRLESETNSFLEIGGFKAHDFFGDGSFYTLEVPGHQAGHVCGLARVTPTNFLFLGADACHHAGVLRTTSKLHRHFPCPGELLAATRRSVSATHFPPSNLVGEFDLASRTTPLLDIAENGYFEDPSRARASIQKMGDFDANADVFVVLAHDESLGAIIGPCPVSLDQWKANGWKEKATWAFVDEKNPAFRFNALDGHN